MKEIRVTLTEEEYRAFRADADRLGISIKKLVHDRVIGATPEDSPLCTAQMLCNEIAQYRESLNIIIRRESGVFPRLYEDDMIRLEMSMCELERIVATFASEIMRRARKDGNA